MVAALTTDPEPSVRMAAARALAKVGSTSEEALAALKSAAKDEDRFVRPVAAAALENLRQASKNKKADPINMK